MSIIAFSSWKNRIAPVFDVSRSIRIVEAGSGQILRQTQVSVPDDRLHLKARRLAALKVEALVCGGISKSMQALIVSHDIEVISFVAGDLQEVIRAWIRGDLTSSGGYTMPGCRRVIANRRKAGNVENKGEFHMQANQRGKRGAAPSRGNGGQGRQRNSGKGKGQRQRAGRRTARMGETAPRASGSCVCPQCGCRVPHESGVPCVHLQCSLCGAILRRS